MTVDDTTITAMNKAWAEYAASVPELKDFQPGGATMSITYIQALAIFQQGYLAAQHSALSSSGRTPPFEGA